MAAATVSPTPVKSSTTVATGAPTARPAPTPPSTLLTDQAQDIPIFLRKTYHMVDTCDPAIACWSDDGETFVVKDPVKFEKSIIPQFFKHSKFSSFVRQLNFYAFRKIKYADTIRIDPKLEAETANYWRFRHEKFQRGRPELLAEIKRMNGQKQQQKNANAQKVQNESQTQKENSALKTEVSTLKQRIEAMSKNIEDLSNMVQQVTLMTQQTPTPAPQAVPEESVNSNNKRTKVEEPARIVPCSSSAQQATSSSLPVPDAMRSAAPPAPASCGMDLDDFLPPSIPSPMPVDRTSTNTSELSDDGFVDQLFTAFKTDEFEFDETESLPESNSPSVSNTNNNNNRPRSELMDRLSDALSNLPVDIQELIVDRLIQAITSPKEIQDNIKAATCLKENVVVANNGAGGKALPQAVGGKSLPQSPKKPVEEKPLGLPLAAATLAALLSQYGETERKPSAAKEHKALLIPVHA